MNRSTLLALGLVGAVGGITGSILLSQAANTKPVPVTPAAAASAPANTNDSRAEMDNFAFKPKELHVAIGAKVTWTNKDDVPHTVTSSDDPKAFDSKTLDTDEEYSFTFTKAGTYRYYCKVHPHMTGVVVVVK